MNPLFLHPLGDLAHLYREIERVLKQSQAPALAPEEIGHAGAGRWLPLVDVREDDGQFVLLADVPGVSPKDIEVSLDGGVLTITGERRVSSEAGVEFRHSEREHGRFLRRFAMPDTADPERVTARGENGVLEIVIQKRREQQPRRIVIDT